MRRRAATTRLARAVLLLPMVLPVHPARAQYPGHIAAYPDPLGASCSLTDVTPGPFNVYILHEYTIEVTGSEFRLVGAGGFTATYLGESINLDHAGDTQTGVSITYPGCISGTLLLATVSYMGYGTSEACSYLVPAPRIGMNFIVVHFCNSGSQPAPAAGPLFVNSNPTCPPWCVVATEKTTWGRVKALYVD